MPHKVEELVGMPCKKPYSATCMVARMQAGAVLTSVVFPLPVGPCKGISGVEVSRVLQMEWALHCE